MAGGRELQPRYSYRPKKRNSEKRAVHENPVSFQARANACALLCQETVVVIKEFDLMRCYETTCSNGKEDERMEKLKQLDALLAETTSGCNKYILK